MSKKLILLLDILICLSTPFAVISFAIVILNEIDPRIPESIGIRLTFWMFAILDLIAAIPVILWTFRDNLKK